MERCTRCGEPLGDQAGWCSLCLRKRTDRAELAEDLRATVGRTAWVPENRYFAPPPPKRYSRTRQGPISFGIWPKVALSLSVIVAGAFVIGVSSWSDLYRDIAAIFVAISGGLFLRAIWRKERIE